MCGRFTLTVSAEELRQLFYIENLGNSYTPRYNIAPGQLIHAVIKSDGKNRIGLLKWGLIPSWSHNEKASSSLINARAETIQVKPAFKRSFHRKRCLIPADGFYEWKQESGIRHPYRFGLDHFSLFAFAGLYDTWIKSDGEKLHTCTIITTSPNSYVKDYHSRMPVILSPNDYGLWLNREEQDFERLGRLLKPFPSERMSAYPVSLKVGQASWDSPECINPIAL